MLSGASADMGSSQEGVSDERTSLVSSFVRTGTGVKTFRKYGTTSSNNGMINETVNKLHPTNFIQYHVQPGDTLQGIALRYKTTMENIKRINKMWSNDTLFLREYLTVPAPPEEGEAQSNSGVATLVIENEIDPLSNGFAYGNGHRPTNSTSMDSVSLNAITSAPIRSQHSRTQSMGRASSSTHDTDKSIQDYLGSIDLQIEQAKSRVQNLQKNSDVLKDLPEVSGSSSWSRGRASSRLRLSLSDLGAEFNAATNGTDEPSTVILSSRSGRRPVSSFYQLEQSRDEIFEL